MPAIAKSADDFNLFVFIIAYERRKVHSVYSVHKVVGVIYIAGRNFAVFSASIEIRLADFLHIENDYAAVFLFRRYRIEFIEVFGKIPARLFVTGIARKTVYKDKFAVGRDVFDLRHRLADVILEFDSLDLG